MFTPRCPQCQSLRIQRAYTDMALVWRAFGFNQLLCNNCNAEFRGFSWTKTKRTRRRNIEVKSRPNVGSLQRAPRKRARVELTLHLRSAHTAMSYRPPHERIFEGYTRDLSRIGMSIILPAAHFTDAFLNQQKHRFLIHALLPTHYGATTVTLHAAAVRFEQLDDDETLTGWLVGARITWINPEDRARYARFVDGVA